MIVLSDSECQTTSSCIDEATNTDFEFCTSNYSASQSMRDFEFLMAKCEELEAEKAAALDEVLISFTPVPLFISGGENVNFINYLTDPYNNSK